MIAAILLGLLAVGVMAWPLLRRGQDAPARDEAALVIFKDQLAEVDRDAARGQIAGADAEAARTEIKRRMLTASRGTSQVGASSGNWLVLAFAVLVPLGGAGIYMVTGSPEVPSQPFAERAGEQDNAEELRRLVTRLRTQLDRDPEGGEARGWELLATTYMNMNRFDDAAYAFEKIVVRPEATSATWSQYAESLIAGENGTVTPKAAKAVQRALELDPTNPAGTFYSALVLEQGGQPAEARQLILDRLADEGSFRPWMPVFVAEANRIGKTIGIEPVSQPFAPSAGPTREDVEAAQEMSAEEQQEFIASMVDRLATRLKDEPGDLKGWLQLARAYMVLDRRDDARNALLSAKPLIADLPADDPMRRAVETGLSDLGG
jgi:cytochrome c-type biogenesis protein CcmH